MVLIPFMWCCHIGSPLSLIFNRLKGRVYRKEVGLKGSIIPLHNCIKGYFSLGLGKISQIGLALGK